MSIKQNNNFSPGTGLDTVGHSVSQGCCGHCDGDVNHLYWVGSHASSHQYTGLKSQSKEPMSPQFPPHTRSVCLCKFGWFDLDWRL